METGCVYLTEDRILHFSSDEPKWKNRIEALAKEYPDECVIKVRPENNDGCINADLPAAWLKIKPPRKVNMTEEQRMAAAERMRKIRSTEEETGDEDID